MDRAQPWRIQRETGQEARVPKKLRPDSSISLGLRHAEDDSNMTLGRIAVTESDYERSQTRTTPNPLASLRNWPMSVLANGFFG